VAYHDREWGVPVHDDRALFEFLILEGAQAGLSWETILRKRENYARAFDNFDPQKVARYTKARNNLAVVLTGAGRLAEARAELRAALDVEPRSADLLVNMALVEKADQHAEQAVELLIRALTTSPRHAAAHYNVAVLYEERDSLALAVDHYNAFLKYAGPEHGTLLSDVQRRVRAIEPRLQRATN